MGEGKRIECKHETTGAIVNNEFIFTIVFIAMILYPKCSMFKIYTALFIIL